MLALVFKVDALYFSILCVLSRQDVVRRSRDLFFKEKLRSQKCLGCAAACLCILSNFVCIGAQLLLANAIITVTAY